MKNKLFLTGFLFVLLSSGGAAHAHATGNEGGGGGDMCEDRIKIIRDDLASWIRDGGPAGLTLPSGISASAYSSRMMRAISLTQIECVSKGDKHFPIQVFGRPKVCRFESGADLMTCDFNKFNGTSAEDQYRLIHHEFAGLAGLEKPDKADSHYEISNQISGYLVDTVVKKLAVNPDAAAPPSSVLSENTLAFRSDFSGAQASALISALLRVGVKSSNDGRLEVEHLHAFGMSEPKIDELTLTDDEGSSSTHLNLDLDSNKPGVNELHQFLMQYGAIGVLYYGIGERFGYDVQRISCSGADGHVSSPSSCIVIFINGMALGQQ